MTWVTWRLYRVQWAIALALLAAFAAIELTDGLRMASQWHALVAACGPAAYQGGSCGGRSMVSVIGNDLRVLSVLVPALVGIFWGAPLAAHEMETGTTSFAWTQGITRARWLAVKCGWLLLAAALWGGAVGALVTWWSGPENAQGRQAFTPDYFDTQGIVPIGYAVFAAALGIAAGALLRRTLPAIAVTLGGFIGVRLLVSDLVRPHLLPAITTITSLASTWSPSGQPWVLGGGAVSPTGQFLTAAGSSPGGVPVNDIPAACQALAAAAPGAAGAAPTAGSGPLIGCLSRAGFRQFITYQPGYRFWPFQGLETGIFLVLAAALVAVAFWAVRRRDA